MKKIVDHNVHHTFIRKSCAFENEISRFQLNIHQPQSIAPLKNKIHQFLFDIETKDKP